jgi:hypothetical protein
LSEVFILEIKVSQWHKVFLSLIVLLSFSAVLISSLSIMQMLLALTLIVVFAILSLKKIASQTPTKLILQKDKQQIFFKSTPPIITKTLTYSYLTNYLTILKSNQMYIVLFKDSCVNHSLVNLNIFLKTNAWCRR